MGPKFQGSRKGTITMIEIFLHNVIILWFLKVETRQSSGRPRKTTKATDRRIVREQKKDPFMTQR